MALGSPKCESVLVLGIPKCQPARAGLRAFNCLPVVDRVSFKLGCLTYKGLTGLAPTYLQDKLIAYTPGRTLQSGSHHLLRIPPISTQCRGGWHFTYLADKVWNSLPLDVKASPYLEVFRKKLKLFIFPHDQPR